MMSSSLRLRLTSLQCTCTEPVSSVLICLTGNLRNGPQWRAKFVGLGFDESLRPGFHNNDGRSVPDFAVKDAAQRISSQSQYFKFPIFVVNQALNQGVQKNYPLRSLSPV